MLSAPEAPAVSEAPAGRKTETPVASAAETMRTSEPAAPPQTNAEIPMAAAVQEIAVRIAAPQQAQRAEPQYVDLHLTERAGEIHVAVRTPDVALQTSLRQDLGSLANSLERAGYHAETFVPRAAEGSQANSKEERQPGQHNSGPRRSARRSGGEGKSASGDRQAGSKNWSNQDEHKRNQSGEYRSGSRERGGIRREHRDAGQPECIPATAGGAVEVSGSRQSGRWNRVRHAAGAIQRAVEHTDMAGDLDAIKAAVAQRCRLPRDRAPHASRRGTQRGHS